MYHAKKVKRWLANSTVKRYLEVFFLPAYSPELNPDEYLLDCDLKNMLHSGAAIRSVKELKTKARSCMFTSVGEKLLQIEAYKVCGLADVFIRRVNKPIDE